MAHAFDPRVAAAGRTASRAAQWLFIGRIALQGFSIALALIVFANLQDRSETIIVALIGLVFAGLRATTGTTACAQLRIALLLENEIRVGRQTATGATASSSAADGALEQSLDASATALRIDYAGLIALAAICLYHLAVAILYGMAYRQLLELH